MVESRLKMLEGHLNSQETAAVKVASPDFKDCKKRSVVDVSQM